MKEFRLAQVLSHRERREAARQQEHSALTNRYLEAAAQLEAMVAEHQRLAGHLAAVQCAQRWDPTVVEQGQRYLDRLVIRIREYAEGVVRLEQAVAAARLALVAASQDRQALARLKERHDEVQRREVERQETKEDDSQVTARAGWQGQHRPLGVR